MTLGFFNATFVVMRKHEKLRPEWDSSLDLRDAGAVLHQLSYQTDWGVMVMWVYDKPADDGYRSTYMMLQHENQIKSF